MTDDMKNQKLPEGWLSVDAAINVFCSTVAELIPAQLNQFDSQVALRIFAETECSELAERAFIAVLTNDGAVIEIFPKAPVSRGVFELNVGLIGKRRSLGGILAGDEPHDAPLPADLEPHRARPVLIHTTCWGNLVAEWCEEHLVQQKMDTAAGIDFSRLSDDFIGRWIIGTLISAKSGGLKATKDADTRRGRKVEFGMWDYFKAMADGNTLIRKRFDEIWRREGRKAEHRHLRMSEPGRRRRQD